VLVQFSEGPCFRGELIIFTNDRSTKRTSLVVHCSIQTNKQTPWPLVRKRTIPTGISNNLALMAEQVLPCHLCVQATTAEMPRYDMPCVPCMMVYQDTSAVSCNLSLTTTMILERQVKKDHLAYLISILSVLTCETTASHSVFNPFS
jgi:hypothetical protein